MGETDRLSKFPLPGWVLALVLLGFGGGGAVAGVRGLTTADSTAERVRALEVKQEYTHEEVRKTRQQLEEINRKLDALLRSR